MDSPAVVEFDKLSATERGENLLRALVSDSAFDDYKRTGGVLREPVGDFLFQFPRENKYFVYVLRRGWELKMKLNTYPAITGGWSKEDWLVSMLLGIRQRRENILTDYCHETVSLQEKGTVLSFTC